MKKKFSKDLFYSILAIGLTNFVLQLIVYPIINKKIGSIDFGNFIFLVAVMNVISPALGLAYNNSRLVIKDRDSIANGDFCFGLLIISIILSPIAFFLAKQQGYSILIGIIFALIVIIASFRYYSSVEYRISLNFQKQFIFYLVLTIGYLIGAVITYFTKQWIWVFLIGEILGLLYVGNTGKIYEKAYVTDRRWLEVNKKAIILVLSYLLTNIMINVDKFVLFYCADSESVSTFYVFSLIGKTIAIISGPINSIAIGYLSKSEKKISLRNYSALIGVIVVVGLVFWGITIIATPIFVKILYPSLYINNIIWNILINASQILYFISSIVLVVILTICDTKWQLWIQIGYTLLVTIGTVVSTLQSKLNGFVIALFCVNMVYFVFVTFFGWFKIHVEESRSKL